MCPDPVKKLPDPDPAGFEKPDPDPAGQNHRIRILTTEKIPVFSLIIK